MKTCLDSNYFASANAAADFSGAWLNADQVFLVGAIVTFTGGGAPNGTLNIDASNEESETKTNYASVATRTVNADASYYIEKADFAFKFVRIRYARSSGTGSASGSTLTKGA